MAYKMKTAMFYVHRQDANYHCSVFGICILEAATLKSKQYINYPRWSRSAKPQFKKSDITSRVSISILIVHFPRMKVFVAICVCFCQLLGNTWDHFKFSIWGFLYITTITSIQTTKLNRSLWFQVSDFFPFTRCQGSGMQVSLPFLYGKFISWH